jgi:catechol 2,3-dioxygenase
MRSACRCVAPAARRGHGVSEALYLCDPDQNGVELYWDRQPADWPRDSDGGLAMFTRQLDLDDLLRHLEV